MHIEEGFPELGGVALIALSLILLLQVKVLNRWFGFLGDGFERRLLVLGVFQLGVGLIYNNDRFSVYFHVVFVLLQIRWHFWPLLRDLVFDLGMPRIQLQKF